MRKGRVNSRRVVVTALISASVLFGAGCSGSRSAVPADRSSVGGWAPVRATTAEDLRAGLLGLEDVPAGFAPVTGTADEDGARAVFEGAGCRELVQLLNAEPMPGSRAHAAVALSKGSAGAAAAELLYTMDSSRAAAEVIDRHRRAASACTEVTLSVAGAGASTSAVRPISLVEVGDDSYMSEVRAGETDSFADQNIIQVIAHSGPVVIAVTLMGADREEAAAVTRAAVGKVHHTFAT